VPAILTAAHRLKQAGADVVVLSMHWGVEYDHLATDEQRQQAHELLASKDIDLILGDHAHVVQPAQRIALRMPRRDLGGHGGIARHRSLDRLAAIGGQLAVDPGMQFVFGRGRGGAVHGLAAVGSFT